ncbi:MAG: hypothetical protein GX755_09495 [Syntrophomonadaceae bacterium]|nr:hypothetical protein [Syntrophomonadaceae bacterium]
MARGIKNRSRQRPSVPRHLIQNLVQDMVSMMENEESHPLALELVDQLPEELQAIFIENLSTVHQVELSRFFWLVAEEYSGEVQKAAKRALEKYRLLGLAVDDWQVNKTPIPTKLYKALISRTRLTGQVSLVMAWEQPNGLLDVRYFVLKFGPEGIQRYFRVLNLSKHGFQMEHNPSETGLVEITFAEAQYLLQESYKYNQLYGTRPARPFFQYEAWLKEETTLAPDAVEALAGKINEKKLKPQHTANAFFVAEQNQDWGLVYDLYSSRSTVCRRSREEYLQAQAAKERKENCLYLSSNIEEQVVRRKTADVQARLIVNEDFRLEERKYGFSLVLEGDNWKINRVKLLETRKIDEDDPDNPLNYEVYCALYTISETIRVQDFLEELPEVEVFSEMEDGLHYRWPRYPDQIEHGINIADTVFSEFILTSDELLIVARDRGDLDSICSLAEDRLGECIQYQQQYYVDISLVYAVLGGEYSSFEELLGDLAVEEPEEKAPVMIATYQVDNPGPVLKRIRSFTVFEFDTPEGVKAFYEFEHIRSRADGGEVGEGFIAEYRISAEYLTVATFGREYLALVCQELERGLKRNLRLIDVQEQKEDYSLLAAVGKAKLPKEIMMRWQKEEVGRWMQTEIPALEGMTPQQANRSLRGRQLLWELFKYMKDLQQDLQRKGLNPPIDYREYIRAVGLGDSRSGE